MMAKMQAFEALGTSQHWQQASEWLLGFIQSLPHCSSTSLTSISDMIAGEGWKGACSWAYFYPLKSTRPEIL